MPRITFEQVAAEVAKLDTNRDNPTIDRGQAQRCVYTKTTDDFGVEHCIAGEILSAFEGVRLPAENDIDNGRAIRDLAIHGKIFGLDFEGDALELIASLQNDADYVTQLDDMRRSQLSGERTITAWQYAVEHNPYLRAKDVQ